ncbi:MAG TPA: biosynthetic peptidoglycan transglycosylase [Bacteroidales bacterium]|nr:biosynthetic peptidoglycan transglycosylase [Bacteroidales bacterium]
MNLNRYLSRKYIGLALVIIFIVLNVLFFSLRGLVLRKAIEIINTKIKSHNYTAYWEGARFRGLKTVFIKQIYIRSESGNNEAQIDSLSAGIRVTPLIFGNIRFKKVQCTSLILRYHSDDSIAKVEELKEIKPDSTGALDFLKGKDFAGMAYNTIRRFIHYIPGIMDFKHLEVRLYQNGTTSIGVLNNFRLDRKHLSADIILSDKTTKVSMPLTGMFDRQASLVSIELVHTDTGMLPVPLLKERYGIMAGFDSLSFSMNFSKRNRHLTNLTGRFGFAGLVLGGKRLSTDKIRINDFYSSFKINLGNDYIEVDSSSVSDLNSIRLRAWLRVETGDSLHIHFKMLPQTWDAQAFFSSLPEGMFTSLIGMKAEGKLHFFLDFSVDPDNPDSLTFNTRLTGEDFNIQQYGADDYRVLNGSFRYQAYDKGRLMATYIVGPENPGFVTIDQISPFLKASVMTSEDGSFYFHNGFNADAFRESIATNIREGRFARGGSTISMQLARNVFLNRNKTVARKIEEALIVWLIENKRLVSKQRMYEVYLNIIEWGPGIYGINDASHFYFNKRPADLNLQESIYLASIVPRPKWYKYTFESNGVMRSFYSNYFNRMKQLMVRKQFISSLDTFAVKPDVVLTGNASKVFADTIRTREPVEMDMLPSLNYFDRKLQIQN